MLPARRQLLRVLGCAACAGPGWLAAQPGANAWTAAQQEIDPAAAMAARVVSVFDGLANTVARALAERDRLTALLAKQQPELADLRADKERLLGEYRSGLFCSGCNQTKSQILAKGQEFPHPGQQIVRPTEQQIKEKERQLQTPIDALQARVTENQRQLQQQRQRASDGVDQLVHGLRLWNTAATYWTHATGHGLRQRAAQLKLATDELAELHARTRHMAALPGAAAGLAREAEIIGRQLQQRQADQTAFGQLASEVGAELIRRRSAQSQRLAQALDQPLLRLAVPGPTDYRAASRLDAPLMLGVFFQMGAVPDSAQAGLTPLPAVAAFVDRFKASPIDLPNGPASASPPSPTLPASAPPRTASPLLEKLP